jgi:hypothetical protein
LGQMGNSGIDLAHRDALITADYAKGISTIVIGEKYGVDPSWVCRIAKRKGAPRRIARPTFGGGAKVALYIPKALHKRAEAAAAQRGLTVGLLISRLARLTLSDESLLDNVLDDGIQTGGGQ